MSTFYLHYSTGITQKFVCKSLTEAKKRATKGFTYQMELSGESVTIYHDNHAICYKSFNKFTQKSSNIGKWITI